MPNARAVPADRLPTLWSSAHRNRSRTAASSVLGTPGDHGRSSRNINQHRLQLLLRLLHVRPCLQSVPTGQAGPRLIAFAGLLMACFSPVQTPGRASFFEPAFINQQASAVGMSRVARTAPAQIATGTANWPNNCPHAYVLLIDESPTQTAPVNNVGLDASLRATFTFFACRTSRAATCAFATARRPATARRSSGTTRNGCTGPLAACSGVGRTQSVTFRPSSTAPCTVRQLPAADLMRQTKGIRPLAKKFVTVRCHGRWYMPDASRSGARWKNTCCGYFVRVKACFARELWEASRTSVDVRCCVDDGRRRNQATAHEQALQRG